MNLPPQHRLSRFVEPEVDQKRIDRVWSAIASHPVRTVSPWRFAPLAGVLAVAAVVVLVVIARGRPTPASLAGVVVESGANQVVTLPDGTSATLRLGARLRYDHVGADRVELTIEKGGVAFDVHHDESRAFVVHAGGVDVVDRGTRFVVDVAGDAVHVFVESGHVEVTRVGTSQPPITLGAGESWTNGSADSGAATSSPSAASAPSPSELPTVAASDAPAPAPSIAISAPAPSAPPAGPRDLLQTANAARLAGHPRDAAAAYDTLRRNFRGDPRAGLAAFELGRLRMDALGDAAGAVEAFNDCIALAPGAPFREDAAARLVQAYDRMHATASCAAARKAYLAQYPTGVHAADVASRCP